MGATEAPGVTGPPFGDESSPLKRRPGPKGAESAPPRCRARPQEPGDATPAAPRAAGTVPPRREGESLPVAQPEGRGNSARVPRQPALWELGGATPQGVGGRGPQRSILGTGAGSQTGGGRKGRAEKAGAAGAVDLPVYSAGALKSGAAAAPAPPAPARDSRPHSPPPGAFSPVRSRARAVRGGRR